MFAAAIGWVELGLASVRLLVFYNVKTRPKSSKEELQSNSVVIYMFNGKVANFIENSIYYNCKVSSLFLKLWLRWVASLLRYWALSTHGAISPGRYRFHL